jgi:uncharacterized protein
VLRSLLNIAVSVGLAYVALCAAMFVFQRSLIYFPQPRFAASAERTVTLQVGGETVRVSVRPRDGPRAVVYFGGSAEDVSRSLPELTDAFPGHTLYLLHYRGYGGSSGSPSESALFSDGLALMDHALAGHPQVTVFGRSLGSAVAVHVASRRPTARLVLVTPFDSLLDVAAAHYPWVPSRWLLRDRYESWRDAPRVTAPTSIIAAEFDEVIPRSSTERLLGRFGAGIATLRVIPATYHNTVSNSPRYRALLKGVP